MRWRWSGRFSQGQLHLAEPTLDSLDRLGSELNTSGFVEWGLVDIDEAKDRYREHFERYESWVNRNYHGEMGYLARGLERRADPRLVFPEAQAVLCVLRPYSPSPIGSTERSKGARYARYLRTPDYHREMTQGLNQALERFAVAESLSQLKWKVCVDTSAVLERAWAELTGLGWIGKNTLLIHPRLGSYVFIGVAFLNRSFHRGPRTQKNLCGNCARCLQGCPTRAFPEPGVLDARACISYLTLEKRGEFNENENQLVASTGFVAGCDICQEVCPFNYKPAKAAESPQKTDPSLAQRLPSDWDKLLEETEQAYRERTRGTALARIKPTDFQRNVRVVYSANRKP